MYECTYWSKLKVQVGQSPLTHDSLDYRCHCRLLLYQWRPRCRGRRGGHRYGGCGRLRLPTCQGGEGQPVVQSGGSDHHGAGRLGLSGAEPLANPLANQQ